MQGRFQTLLKSRLAAVVVFVASAAVALVVVAFALGGGDETSQALAEPSVTPATATATASPTSRPTATPEASPTPIEFAGILDGLPMTAEQWAARKDTLPLAVMVDNTAGAVPHAGLDKADLVYETFVEGGITRLMAVYWRQDAEKILPVRSARTPFLTWASELRALYAHAGGAQTTNEANAIGQIFEWKVPALNAFAPISSNYYYRDADRRNPYDLATSTGGLREAAGQMYLLTNPTVESWKFREPGVPLPPGEPAGGIAVEFSGRLISWQYIQWKWDAATKRYLRFQFGGPQIDAVSGGQLAFATVIVMRTRSSVVDDDGHVLLEQLGSGPATVFTGGQAYSGVWKKESREARTRFYADDGTEIVFERGPIFIEAIAQQSKFSFLPEARDLPELPAFVPPPPGSLPEDAPEEPTLLPTAEPTATATATATAEPPTRTPTTTPTPRPTGTPTRTATPTVTLTPSPVP